MKKTLTLAFLVIGIMANAQTKEYFNFSIGIDPSATVKEKSPNLVAELEYVQKYFYIKATTQILPDLEGGYLDYGGGAGLNYHLGMFEKTRLYTGGRLGFIRRGSETYPLAGLEAGINQYLTDNFYIGLRATSDKREDFQFWGGETENRISGFVKFGINF